MSRAMLSGGSG